MRIRGMRRRALAVAMLWCATGVIAVSAVHAQTPPAGASGATAGALDPKIEEAREAFRVGSAFAKQSQWVDALSAFERSARLRPHAVTTYNIGFCERALGRFTRAKKSLSRALAAQGDELPSSLAAEARGYLAEIDGRISRAVITLTRTGGSVSVDGRPLEATGGKPECPELVAGTREPGPAEPVTAKVFDLALDPGTHVVVVSAAGVPASVVTRDFAAGATVSFTIMLATVAPPKPVGFSTARRTGVIVSFALAGAMAIAGATFGGFALKNKGDLDGQCVPKDQCPSSAQGTIDGMKTLATLSTLSIAGAVASTTIGVVLLATGNSSPRHGPPGPTATPWIGPGSFGVRGSF